MLNNCVRISYPSKAETTILMRSNEREQPMDGDRKQRDDGILEDMVRVGLWEPVFQQRLGGEERWPHLPGLGAQVRPKGAARLGYF